MRFLWPCFRHPSTSLLGAVRLFLKNSNLGVIRNSFLCHFLVRILLWVTNLTHSWDSFHLTSFIFQALWPFLTSAPNSRSPCWRPWCRSWIEGLPRLLAPDKWYWAQSSSFMSGRKLPFLGFRDLGWLTPPFSFLLSSNFPSGQIHKLVYLAGRWHASLMQKEKTSKQFHFVMK